MYDVPLSPSDPTIYQSGVAPDQRDLGPVHGTVGAAGSGMAEVASLPRTGDTTAAMAVLGMTLLVGGTSVLLTVRRPVRT